MIDGIKCVVVNEALSDVEPMAWDFVMNFARDNDLQVVEACLLPEVAKPESFAPAAAHPGQEKAAPGNGCGFFRVGPVDSAALALQQRLDLADDAAAKREHADHEHGAHDDRTR